MTTFNPARTLPLRVETLRQLRRRRTAIALGFLAVLPLIIVGAFALGSGSGESGDTFTDLAQQGGLNLAVFVLFAATGLLLVVAFALFFGDSVSSEASWGSLRYLLASPIPRARLLRQKCVVAAGFGLAALLILTVSSLVVGSIAYGWHPLESIDGDTLSPGTALVRLGVVLAYLAVSLIFVAGAAFWLSTVTDAPLGAVGGAVGIVILSNILDTITALGDWRSVLPTRRQFAWTDALQASIGWDDMAKGAVVSLIYGLVFTALAFWHFTRKDIVS